jgi:hypothetical protein
MVQMANTSASHENITVFWFQSCMRVCRDQMQTHAGQTVDARKMENEPPSWLNSWVKLHVPRPTHVSHEASCTPSSMRSLFHELRIKVYHSHHFGIIINYYSQGLKPLILAPFSNLSAPFPLPTLWKLSPPSLFLHGWSARSDV